MQGLFHSRENIGGFQYPVLACPRWTVPERCPLPLDSGANLAKRADRERRIAQRSSPVAMSSCSLTLIALFQQNGRMSLASDLSARDPPLTFVTTDRASAMQKQGADRGWRPSTLRWLCPSRCDWAHFGHRNLTTMCDKLHRRPHLAGEGTTRSAASRRGYFTSTRSSGFHVRSK
jgi:hypothetical protein